MKKLLAIMLVFVMCLGIFTACGSKTDSKASKKKSDAAVSDDNGSKDGSSVKGDDYYTGTFKVFVPKGWGAVQVKDYAEEGSPVDPDAIRIVKDGTSEADVFSKPNVMINYAGPDTEMVPVSKDFYDEPEDVEPVIAGDITWEGYKCKSMDYPMYVLYYEDGGNQYQATVWYEIGSNKISIDDADVLAILASVAPSDAPASN